MSTKVKLDLTKVDGNAFSLIGAFMHQARLEGWSSTDIDNVVTDCMSSDYDHLVATLANVCESP